MTKPKISTNPEVLQEIYENKITPLPDFPRGEYRQEVQTPIKQIKIAPSPVYVAQVTPITDNERAVWDFLITRFTRNQTSGIMGNLQQEHNFQTSGDGLAQWNGGRKARLMAMANPYSLDTQLQFLMIELNESGLEIPDEVVTATRTFQNSFERCGQCNEPARISYAYAILERY